MTAPIPRDIPDLPAIPGTPVRLPSPVPAAAVVPAVRRPLTAAFRILTALMAAAGVTLCTLLGSPLRVLSHFTIQSSMLLTVVCLLSAHRAWTARRPLPSALTGATLLYVVIAALAYHLLPANTARPFSMTGTATLSGWDAVANQLLHSATLAAAGLDWLLLTTPGHLHLRQTATWLGYPLAYLALSLTLAAEQHGYMRVLANALLMSLSFCALAVLLVALDHARPNRVRHRLRIRSETGFRLQPPVG